MFCVEQTGGSSMQMWTAQKHTVCPPCVPLSNTGTGSNWDREQFHYQVKDEGSFYFGLSVSLSAHSFLRLQTG